MIDTDYILMRMIAGSIIATALIVVLVIGAALYVKLMASVGWDGAEAMLLFGKIVAVAATVLAGIFSIGYLVLDMPDKVRAVLDRDE